MQFSLLAAASLAAGVASAHVVARDSPSYSNNSIVIIDPVINVDIVIGIEFITYVEITEVYNIVNEVTVTDYSTSICSTEGRPIYKTKPAYPCYACALEEEDYYCPPGGFIYATATYCQSGPVPTPYKPVVRVCETCEPYTLHSAPPCETEYYKPEYVTPVSECTATTEYTTTCTTPGTTYTPYTTPTPLITPTAHYSAPVVAPPAQYTGAAVAKQAGLGAVAFGAAAFALL